LGGGGWVTEERRRSLMGVGGGVAGRENACVVFEIPILLEKIHRAVTLDPTHISLLNSCNH
jgi:hypothetical protein